MHYTKNNPYSLLLLFAKPFQSEMHIKYRRIELCKSFIFWVAVSLKLLRELQCVKQEISPLKKKRARICALDNCGRFKNQTYVEAAFHYCAAPAP